MAEPAAFGQRLEPLGQPVVAAGRRVARAPHPLTGAAGELRRALAQGGDLLQGFRNRDPRGRLFGACADASERRRPGAKATRLLALPRAPGLIVQVRKAPRPPWSALGRRVTPALPAAHAAEVQELTEVP